MNPSFRRSAVAVAACGALILVGCSQQGSSPAPDAVQQQAQTQAAEASKQLDTYRELLRIKNDQMASSLGQDIVDHYPNTAEAKEVQQTLPEVQQRWKDNSEQARLKALWLYQVGPMEGGTQSTATIYSSKPTGDHMVRLILRRHTSWGQSVFLFGSGHGFVCKGNCTIPATFDGKPHGLRAFLPTTGEPAIFIRDDKDFITAMRKAKKITMDVTLQDGEEKETLVYEVAGFDPDKWVGVGKGVNAKAESAKSDKK
jgi:hypothetical protein